MSQVKYIKGSKLYLARLGVVDWLTGLVACSVRLPD